MLMIMQHLQGVEATPEPQGVMSAHDSLELSLMDCMCVHTCTCAASHEWNSESTGRPGRVLGTSCSLPF